MLLDRRNFSRGGSRGETTKYTEHTKGERVEPIDLSLLPAEPFIALLRTGRSPQSDRTIPEINFQSIFA